MGVKLMNLAEGVRVAKVAKVREKLSDGNDEIDDVDAETDAGTEDGAETATEEPK